MEFRDVRIAVIGLGYVGLPLAVEFGRKFSTLRFDIDSNRIASLRKGVDTTHELTPSEVAGATFLEVSDDASRLADCNVFIVTVPTPVDIDKRPDLSPLVNASDAIGRVLKRNDIVIYESTVFPGATEEVCVPVLERVSGLRLNLDFFVGYSPERINPGDKTRRLASIPKVTSGSTPEAAQWIDDLYSQIITAGTHKAPSIKVAEASKVIENTQRDANIALINEFSLIFHRLGIDTRDVLDAARTKWNFLPFEPGLVGGHCIGVDPYYLIQKAQSVGYYPDTLLACRRINEAMGQHVASEVVRLMVLKGCAVKGSRVLVLGFTFKEDCSDTRNTRVVDLISGIERYGAKVDVFDPLANAHQVEREYGVKLRVAEPERGAYDAVVLAVAHKEFRSFRAEQIRALGRADLVVFDVKGVLPREVCDGRL